MKDNSRHICRAKKLTGEWVEGYLTCMDWRPDKPCFIHYVDKREPDNVEVDPGTICAFVCTIPNACVKLWENDIVDYAYDLYRIVWCDSEHRYLAESNKTGDLYDLDYLHLGFSSNIICNYFDNPELWKGGEE